LLAPFLGATLSAMLSTDPARAQSIRADLAYPNRQVSAAVVSGSTLYIGGSFDHVGFTTGNAVPIDAATGQVQPFPIVDGEVRAVAPDGAGGWYIGGSFQTVGGLLKQDCAHPGRQHRFRLEPEHERRCLRHLRDYGLWLDRVRRWRNHEHRGPGAKQHRCAGSRDWECHGLESKRQR
jgi:hypothetical protein